MPPIRKSATDATDESPAPPADESTRDLRVILDAVVDGVMVIGADGRVEQINDEACRMLETSAELARGRRLSELVAPEHPMQRLAVEVLQGQGRISDDDVLLQRRFGNDLEVEIAVSPLTEDSEQVAGLVFVLRDRTLGNSLREQASQRERLDSYGHIAAGIAHEVKNPLGGIRGAAELLLLRAEDERSRRTAELIVREVDRITALVDDLMVFAKGEKLECQALNIHRLLDQVLDVVEADPLAASVAFERVYDPSIPELRADPARLTQVFLNLARNAIQALGEQGGRLTITTRMSLQGRFVGEDGRSRPTLEVIFRDDGPGIEPSIKDRLATPFFTTRPTGTGLGLAVSRHWVTKHGGSMKIESEPGHGASVRVALPLEAADSRTPVAAKGADLKDLAVKTKPERADR